MFQVFKYRVGIIFFSLVKCCVTGLVIFGAMYASFINGQAQEPVIIQEIIVDTKVEMPISDIIKGVCDKEGVPWIECILVADCESKMDRYFKEKVKGGSYDRGLFAINSYHYKHISDDCAFDPECSAKIFAKAYKEGKANDWLCYKLIGK